jgi:hypothetical protein
MSVRLAALAGSLLLVLSLGFALAPSAGAQARVEEKVGFGVTGEVAAVDAEARTIKVKGEHDEGLVYDVDGSATVLAGSEGRSLGDLAVGSSVVMNGHGEGSRRVVTYIKVVKAPAP